MKKVIETYRGVEIYIEDGIWKFEIRTDKFTDEQHLDNGTILRIARLQIDKELNEKNT